jgi:hypothetical protein
MAIIWEWTKKCAIGVVHWWVKSIGGKIVNMVSMADVIGEL